MVTTSSYQVRATGADVWITVRAYVNDYTECFDEAVRVHRSSIGTLDVRVWDDNEVVAEFTNTPAGS